MSGARSVLVVLGAAAATGACLPQPATSQARGVTDLWTLFLVAGALVGGLVWGLLTLVILRQWRPPSRRSEAEPTQVHGSRLLESVWTIGPVITIGVLFALTLAALGRVEARAPEAGVELRVEAYRWGWRFDYPAEGVSVGGSGEDPPVAVLPVGMPVHVTLTAVDVVHAWYVPEFLYKRDATPGRVNTFDLVIERPGSYGGQCAEFCGLLHSRMPFTVEAVDDAAYRAWLGEQGAAP